MIEQYTEPAPEQQQRSRRRSGYGCLALLLALALLAGGAYFAFNAGVDALQERFNPPEDYSGDGSGSVLVEVEDGDAASDIATNLADKDVVASAEAFTDAAQENPDSVGIQVGFYEMNREMSAESALEILLDPDNIIQSAVAFPEGWTVDQIVARLVRETDFSRRAYERLLDRPRAIGLPAYAGGNPEGYLFPATYQLRPDATAKSILSMMVERWAQAAKDADLEASARKLGYTPDELMVVASLVESEASRAQDRAKVARVIYNRLEGNETDGLLQLDATVNYAAGRDLGARTTDEDRRIDSPYNTYQKPGLPPTPIEAPGEAAIEAAADPADGGWNYYVTVNLRTGETKFAESYREHLRNKAELDEYCRAQSDAC
ncbi:MAG: FIG004453: protein YceG like [uncultured Nocardioidaceae bacterium]|uniref:Endolytic murein transglycosylase n=1 Tax=uncultured Nocardioidaceae bacterium TaxID=253824 RepID=A0A6J4MMZ9_9ACTN|nr:MAG: FIG004453: protein YceG like [uncultured Nocardioidaceae bacterium]